MADEPLPPLETKPAQIDDIIRRLGDVESQLSLNSLTSENQYCNLLISEVTQRIRMRYAVSALAVVVISIMMFFAMHIVHHYFVGPLVLISPSLAIVLFLAPVTSITAVTITLLVGVFRRFKDDDMEKIDAKSIISEAVKVAQPH